MCAILYLEAGVMPTVEQIENACYNNWHSYGLVTKVDGKLDIKRVLPESGEVDPKEVYDALAKDIKYERFLHLRHTTAGATSAENVHPFEVFYSEKRHVVFMHNGTLYPFKSKKTVNQQIVDDDDGPSDSKNFADRILSPYLAACDFGNGHGDYSHPLFRKIVIQNWSGSNRGILISNDQKPWLIDQWKEIVGKDGKKFQASNDDYFKSVTRGPEKARRDQKAIADRASRNVIPFSNDNPVANIRDFNFEDSRKSHYDLSSSPANILNDWDVYQREAAVAVGYATRAELESLYSSKDDCITLMDWIFTDYLHLYEEFLEIENDKANATKLIATLKKEISGLKDKKEAA